MQSNRDDGRAATSSDAVVRATVATALIVAATVAFAITSVIRSNEQASAQSGANAQPVPRMAAVPLWVPSDSGEFGPFAFGYLEFDWDPTASGGVPGFDSWPPGSRRR
jgi:hypothetical protein